MNDPIVIVPYNEEWKREFTIIGQSLRHALKDKAIRIDHIGSTSIQGLAAKPIIDIQISVKDLKFLDEYKIPMENAGFVFQENNPELTKRYFREAPGTKRTHIHVRQAGSWSEQFALLFRDYVRKHPSDREQYAKLKYELANDYYLNRDGYVMAKEPFIWEIMNLR